MNDTTTERDVIKATTDNALQRAKMTKQKLGGNPLPDTNIKEQ